MPRGLSCEQEEQEKLMLLRSFKWDLAEKKPVQLVAFCKSNGVSTPEFLSALLKEGSKLLMTSAYSKIMSDC